MIGLRGRKGLFSASTFGAKHLVSVTPAIVAGVSSKFSYAALPPRVLHTNAPG